MDSETYYIPVNYTEAGKLFGLFEIRNAIEAVVWAFRFWACAPLFCRWRSPGRSSLPCVFWYLRWGSH